MEQPLLWAVGFPPRGPPSHSAASPRGWRPEPRCTLQRGAFLAMSTFVRVRSGRSGSWHARRTRSLAARPGRISAKASRSA
eukprot:11925495-Alexandrium_andersonii.AAC.1